MFTDYIIAQYGYYAFMIRRTVIHRVFLTHLVEAEEKDISQLSIFVSETFRTFAPKVTTD